VGVSQDPDALDDAELVSLHVAPTHQRRGHGSRLLTAAVDTMCADGYTAAVCWVALAEEPRRAFLQSAGWGPDGALRDLAAPDGTLLREVRLVVGFGPESVA
jgi:ribosomal protein S18 acetylase RimI-like enzyme